MWLACSEPLNRALVFLNWNECVFHVSRFFYSVCPLSKGLVPPKEYSTCTALQAAGNNVFWVLFGDPKQIECTFDLDYLTQNWQSWPNNCQMITQQENNQIINCSLFWVLLSTPKHTKNNRNICPADLINKKRNVMALIINNRTVSINGQLGLMPIKWGQSSSVLILWQSPLMKNNPHGDLWKGRGWYKSP